MRLLAEKLPYSQIAPRLGLTKNAVIGRMSRLGITVRPIAEPASTFANRMQALHDAMDCVLAECRLPRNVMYVRDLDIGESTHA